MIKSHHIRKLLACVLAVAVCMTCSPLTALADVKVKTTGTGIFDDPTVTVSSEENKTVSSTGDTTTTTQTTTEWTGEDEKDANNISKEINGKDTSSTSETRDSSDNLLSGFGSSKGFQTTKTTTFDTPTKITAGEITSEAEPITFTLQPNTATDKNNPPNGNVHAWFKPTDEIVPAWVGDINNGTIKWKNGSSSKDDNVITTITKVGDTSTAGKVTYTREIVSPLKTETEIYSYTLDKDGHIIAWSSDSSVTVPVAATAAELPKYATVFAKGNNTVSAFELPEKPEITVEPVYDNGIIQSGEVVENLYDENGNHVGYARITYENGAVTKYEAFMGTTVATTTTTENAENGLKKYTTTKTIHSQAQGSVISKDVKDAKRTVTASMGKIEGSITPDYTNYSTFKTYTPSEPAVNNGDSSFDDANDLYHCPSEKDASEYDSTSPNRIQWLGKYGIESRIRVKTTYRPHQFVLSGGDIKNEKGETKKLEYYVYCADFDVSPKENAVYNMQRLEDATYYKNNDDNGKALKQIRAIVLNGYWGTKSDKEGSLDKFKQMLANSKTTAFTSDEISSVTDGMALTATQAAIWYYGNSGTDVLDAHNIVGSYHSENDANGKGVFTDVDTDTKNLVNKIYQYLINTDGAGLKAQEATVDNTLLTEDDFAKSVKLTVGEKNDDETYNVDIDIIMDKITSGNLTLTVGTDATVINTNDGQLEITNAIATYDLTAKDKNYYDDDDSAYHISGLRLSEGKDIKLFFNGKQTLANGVYLFQGYKNTGTEQVASQTFVGAGNATQNIALSTSFNFSVSEPEFEITSSNSEYTADMIEWESRYEITENRRPHNWNWTKGDTPIPDGEDDPSGETNSEDPTDYPNKPDVNTEKVNSSSKANDADSETAREDADIPKTGDVNDLLVSWFILTAVSAAGCMALLKRKLRSK